MSLSLLKALSFLLNLLPRRVLLGMGDVAGWILYACLRFRRRIVLENLRLAFGDSLTSRQRESLALRNYRHYGKVAFEILQSITWDARKYRERVIVEGLRNVEPYLRSGQGGFFLTCHLGNWEFAIAAAASVGIPLDVVVKRARTPQGEKILQWYRRKTGAGIFLESGTAKDILRSLSQGRWVGFILDQFMGPPIGLPVNFFGKPAGTAVAVALLTEKKDVPILPAYSYRDATGTVHLVFGPVIPRPPLSEEKEERLYQKTQLYNDVLEDLIRRHPDQWLWLHRRWKEFRGAPRWMPKRGLALAALLAGLALSGCTSGGEALTGIKLPPDPSIPAAPRFVSATEPDRPAKPVSTPIRRDSRAKRYRQKPGASPAAGIAVASPIRKPDTLKVFSPEKIPFGTGERLEMDLRWTAIPAGRAVMEVREGPLFHSRPTFQLWGNVLSSRLVDAFYHMDNTVESYIDKTALAPYKFLLHMMETFQKKETRAAFDHANHQVFYRAKRVSAKRGNQDIDRTDLFTPRSEDLFSAVYYARTLDYNLNEQQTIPVYENGRNFSVGLTPVANELVTTKAGVFQCWKLQARVAVDNVLKPYGDSFLWLSDDSKKYVVKFSAKLKYGALVGTLASIQERSLPSVSDLK